MQGQAWLIIIFLGALGACIGSFLNVVIYRCPRGKSVVRPGSQCPRCNHAIRGYHNIPILSWLALGGRCYDCGAPIAGRYALVEAATSAIFFGLAMYVFGRVDGSAALQNLNDPSLWITYGFQVALVCSLLCIFVIRHDGLRPPFALYGLVVVAAVGAAISIALPLLRATSL